MFRTKKDVDKHVQDIHSKIKSPSERNLKGYSIAKLYFAVEDYENARRFLTSYLLEKDTSSVAHKLSGQISEKLNQPDKALESYKRAYMLDPTNDLVLKICGLMLELPMETGRAKHWVEVAEKAVPHNDIVYKLRESMLAATEGENSPALESLLQEEIKARPEDVGLRVRLITLLQRSGKIKEGFKMCSELEKKQPWMTSREWYAALVELCENYQVQYRAACDSQFYSFYLGGMDRLFDIQTREGAGASLLADILLRMDLALKELCSLPVPHTTLSHWRSQFLLNCASLLTKRAVKDEAMWRDLSKLVGQLYLAAWTGEVSPEVSEAGSARKVVSGHMLLILSKGDPQWVERVLTVTTGGLAGSVGEKLFKSVFVTRDQREKAGLSWLSGQTSLVSQARLPSIQEVSSHAAGYISLHTRDLHMLVWLVLNYYSPAKVLDLSFHLPGAGSVFPRENLSALDFSSFLYGLVYCLGWQKEGEEARLVPLPPSLSVVEVTRVQEDWWNVACKALAGTLQPADRRTLQHGVDSLRCSGLHGLDINLTMKLAKTFQRLGLESEAVTDGDSSAGSVVKELNSRAALYYSASLAGLDRLERGAPVRDPSVRLLQPAGNTPSIVEMDKMKEAAHFFLACQKMKDGKHDEALASFKEQKSPYASFYIGEIYKKLALEEKGQTGLLEAGGQTREFLVESRDALYLTLDRLRGLGAGGHPLDSQLSEHLEEVESLLNRQGGEQVEQVDSAALLATPPRKGDPTAARRALSQLTSTPQSQRSIFDGNLSGLRSEARPSPERLDVQMRHLTGELSRTNTELAKTVASVGDSNEITKVVSAVKDVVETNNRILGEIKDNLRIISDDMRELRRDSRTRDERIMDTLKKISDNTDKTLAASASASASNSRASELSAEERLLMESFGLTSGSLATNLQLHLQQQQMIQQQLARQTPNIMASMGYGMNNMYGAAGMYNPPTNANIAPLPQHPLAQVAQVSQRAPPQPSAAPSNVVISVSDPIPHSVPVITAPMTVTVPPQHRLGGLSNSPRGVTVVSTPSTPQTQRQREEPVGTPQSAYKTPQLTPHSYQMRMPNGASPLTVSPFKVDEDPAVVFTTQSLLSSIPSPVISAVTPSPEKAAPLSVTKTRVASGGEGLKADANFKGFAGAGSSQKKEDEGGEDGGAEDDYEPDVHFKPVIPLPELVDTKTGEEEEEALFSHRAKLFRFVSETKEWKERGIGDFKILKHKETGKVRFLMRREQVLKICCNHFLAPSMEFKPLSSSDKAWQWTAADFSEGEVVNELLAVRFKTAELAMDWKKVVDDCLTKLVESPVKSTSKLESKVAEVKTEGGKKEGQTLAQFAAAQKQGSWECEACLTRNNISVIQCVACGAAKPGHEEEVKKLNEAAKPAAAVMTIGAGGGFKFGSGGASTTTATTTAGGFSFNNKATTTTSGGTSSSAGGFGLTAKATVTTTSSFTFGSNTAVSTVSTSSTPSATLGGFSFVSSPVVKAVTDKPEKVSQEKETAAKPSPFAAFSFGGSVGSKIESVKPAATSPAPPVLGSSQSSLTFQSLAGGEGFKADANFKGFAGAGSSLFGQKKEDEGGEDGGAEDDYEPDVHFKPVIPLPELVDTKTGEEEEEALFSHRAKLFRFVSETKEWKERGIGDFKILKHKETGKVRFLMRREQVLKICCNHFLAPSMEFKPLSSSDKAWQWTAADFSEGEVVNELLAVRFKTAELAMDWKKVVDDCLTKLVESPVKNTSKLESKVAEVKTEGGKKEGQTLAQFAAAQKQGSWECEACLTRNNISVIQCVACGAAKPGHEEEVKKLNEAAKPAAAVMTIGAGGGFKFGSGGASTSNTTGGFSFNSTATTSSGTSSTTTGGFSFSSTPTTTSQNSGFSFGTTSSSSAIKTNGDGSKSPFGSSSAHSFSFAGVKASPVKPGASPRKHNESTNSENELYQDDEADNLYFDPVIPLPDKVDTKTGEEEETVLYSHRAKLFRFTNGEWKERGLGDIKILKHEKTGKVRLLMRREQVLKICLNHYVTQQLVSQVQAQDPKSWTWAAQDFSDGELQSMTFALRFKTPEISLEFKKALDEAAENSTSSPVKSGSSSKSTEVRTTSKPAEKTKEKVSSAESDEGLFSPDDFKPLEKLDKEVELSFDGQGLKLNTAEDAGEVCGKISSQGTIHTLTFSGNTIGIEAAGAIGKALETHPELRRAHWKDMFTGRMKTEIPPALVNMTRGLMLAQARLVELDLSDNAFGPVGMEGLKTFLKSPSCFSLQELKLNNTGCGVTGGKMLASLLLECYDRSKAIGHPLALKVFILGRSRQENEGATALAKVFKLMGSLEEVVMPQNGIYYEGLTALADAFSCNPNLRILNMNDNTFTAKGAKAMATALKKLNKLEVLNLGDCLLKSGGAKLICRALAGNHPALRELVLDSNEIRLKGGLEIVNAVKDKPDLIKLSIDANQFGSSGLKKILDKLEEVGKKDIVGETEDNEEPDSDEEDPDVSDDEQTEEKIGEACQPSQPFSFNNSVTNEPKSAAQALLGVSSKTVFGGSGSNSSIFGGSANTTSFKPSGNIFTSPPPASNSIFGNTSSSNTTNTTPAIFGGSGSSSTPNKAFGTPTTSKDSKEATPTASVFTKLTDSKDTGSTFGSSVFGSTSSSTSKPGGLFGKGPSQETVSVSSTTGVSGGSLFGSSSQSGFDFKSLADNSGPGFSTAGEGFKFAGAGASLFGKQNKSVNEDGEDDDEDPEADGHDPHFEPIVPLPELVEVKTGEEEEEEIFKHRAKVYRFCSDTKQWKERGVGDIKILRHPSTGITRVLLRRDQVYKTALNHRITKDMELKPLSNSETAWCWYAMDFSEGHEAEGSMEQLAVRFKGKDTAEAFKAKFENCQENIGQTVSASASVTVSSSKPGVQNESTVSEEAEENEGDEEYVEEEEYDNGDTIMFHNNANLYLKDAGSGQFISQGEVDLKIVYDDDVYGARIMAELPTASSEEENFVCNHLIAMQTNLIDMQWSALDFSTDPPNQRTFKVEFDEEETAAEFKDIFEEGKDLAEQSEILETVEDQDPSSFYYGQGADGEE